MASPQTLEVVSVALNGFFVDLNFIVVKLFKSTPSRAPGLYSKFKKFLFKYCCVIFGATVGATAVTLDITVIRC